MPPDPKVHVGTSAWIESPDGILMMQRGGRTGTAKNGYGKFALPGGWLDFGETPSEAAVRETLEETGLVVEAVDEMKSISFIADDLSFQCIDINVRCRYRSGTPRNMEPEKCLWVGWMPWPELIERYERDELFAPLTRLMEREFDIPALKFRFTKRLHSERCICDGRGIIPGCFSANPCPITEPT